MGDLPKIIGFKSIQAVSFALAFIQGLLCVLIAQSLAKTVTNLWQGNNLESTAGWLAAFAIFIICRAVVTSICDALNNRYAASAVSSMRKELLEAVWKLGPSYTRKQGSAAIVADAVEGLESAETYLGTCAQKTANAIAVPLVLLVAMFTQDFISGVIALVCYPFIILFMRLIGQSAGAESKKRYAEFEHMSASFIDFASGIDTLRSFGAARRFADKVFENSERFRELTMKTIRIAMLSSTVLDLFATLGLAAVAIMLGFRLVEGSIQLYCALFVLVLVPEYFKPIRRYASDYHATLEGKSALEAISKTISLAKNEDRPDVCCAHALEKLNVAPGEDVTVCLQGPSGSGKTTLLNDIAGFGSENPDWLSRIAYIPQNPYIFRASLKDNITFYRPDAAPEEIASAINSVGLKDLAESLPCGLDEMIGEGGRTLSGGQAQRIAVCRALVGGTRDIWLLDEPTSHLDRRTEAELIENIFPLMKGKTVIVASHSDAWRAVADRVVYI